MNKKNGGADSDPNRCPEHSERGSRMFLFKKEKEKTVAPTFPPEEYEPVIRCSICTGEQVACMRHKSTGKLQELMLLRTPDDLNRFCSRYGVSPEQLRKVY